MRLTWGPVFFSCHFLVISVTVHCCECCFSDRDKLSNCRLSWLISCVTNFILFQNRLGFCWSSTISHAVTCGKIQLSRKVSPDTQVSFWQIVHICDVKSIDSEALFEPQIFIDEAISCSLQEWLGIALSFLCTIMVGSFSQRVE